MAQILDHDLGHAFGSAHYRGRVDGFVSRYQNEIVRAIIARQGADEFRRENVIFDRLARIDLHQRNVFVRGGVKDDRGPVIFENLSHARLVADIGDQRNESEFGKSTPYFLFDLEEEKLGAFDQ